MKIYTTRRRYGNEKDNNCTDEYDESDVRHVHVRHDFLLGKNFRLYKFLCGLCVIKYPVLLLKEWAAVPIRTAAFAIS